MKGMVMTGMAEKTAFKRWLDRMDAHIKPTPKGVRLTLTFYVYPDGHGNLIFQNPETGKPDVENQPVDSVEEAVGAFRAVWERAANCPK
jgi:hypothetical protein